MYCTHGYNMDGNENFRMYGSKWPRRKQPQLSARVLKRLYLWHWDHMQCVMARPHHYITYWGAWYTSLCLLCDDYGLQHPATPLEVAHGGSK